jgi:hypothetical protein
MVFGTQHGYSWAAFDGFPGPSVCVYRWPVVTLMFFQDSAWEFIGGLQNFDGFQDSAWVVHRWPVVTSMVFQDSAWVFIGGLSSL